MEISPLRDVTDAAHALSNALDQARREWTQNSDNGRAGMIRALAGAGNFISAVAPECGLKFSRFHMALIAALTDLNEGAVVPLLKPVNIGRGRRTSWSRRVLHWHAAATMASL